MSISPLSPDEIRAAAEVHAELGPEYRDAVVESFLEKIDSETAARIDARLAAAAPRPPRRDLDPVTPRGGAAWRQAWWAAWPWARSSRASR